MRFMEFASPEDQLALWKMVSDNMWAAFDQPPLKGANTGLPQSSTSQGRVASLTKPVAKPIPKTPRKSLAKPKLKPVKPKRVLKAPVPKPPPKPNIQQQTTTQATQQQSQQQKQLALQPKNELIKSHPQQRIYPQPPTPNPKLPTPTVPITNGFDDGNKDDLVFHSSSQDPFKSIGQTKSAVSNQKRSF
jgi:hypothetical protein